MEKIIGYSVAVMALATTAIAWSTLNDEDCCCATEQAPGAVMFDSVMIAPGDTIVLVPGDSIMRKRAGSLSLIVAPGRKGLIYTGTR